MAISVHQEENGLIFSLTTEHSEYQMKVDPFGILEHTYYGNKLPEYFDMSYATNYRRGFSFGCEEERPGGFEYSVSRIPQEISTFGNGDFRESAINLRQNDGSVAFEPRYVSYQIQKGKYFLKGLPAFFDDEGETLVITLKDKVYDIYLHLSYGLLPSCDLICRSYTLENRSGASVTLEKALTLTLDFDYGSYDMVTFYGKHGRERMFQREEVSHGYHVIQSVRGASSHMYNPFAVICDKTADEETGNAYGLAFVYSGNFILSSAKNSDDATRVVMGINPENFNYVLENGETFVAPEVALTYSNEGFCALTHHYHDAIQNHLCRGKYAHARRPVLLNSWEGTYFDFNGDKLVKMAREAKEVGVELFVLDDGWFGKRNDDTTGLGDWKTNEKKLGCTIGELAKRVNDEGLKFGLWFEPECISRDSDLYRAHPDYAFKMPDREGIYGRHQCVLDLSRKEVRDNIHDQLYSVLKSANIEYVKWDFNRHITDLYSVELPKEKQGEVFHRYMLGLYELLERITSEFPNVLFESCSGGGGRFDCGMMYYMPQAWTSDTTDPTERVKIQYGSSFAYPVCVTGAHVSASPNHQTMRTTTIQTRSTVAMFGTYGLELDVGKMTESEKDEIRAEIKKFKEHYDLIQNGKYYRYISPFDNDHTLCAWGVTSKDGKEAVVASMVTKNQCNLPSELVKVKGLNPKKHYTVVGGTDRNTTNDGKIKYLGSALMERGINMDSPWLDYATNFYYIKQVD